MTICREEALKRADQVQKMIDAGELTGPLAGVPVAIKDNMCTEGVLTTCSSKILGNFVPTFMAEAVKRLEEAGAATVMPLGAPIGTNKGLQTRDFLRIIIEQATIPVVVDAGIGAPSHAAEAMEMGASACLVNTAIAVAGNPTAMAQAFKQAVEAGRMAYEAGLGLQADSFVAEASSPLTAFLNE